MLTINKKSASGLDPGGEGAGGGSPPPTQIINLKTELNLKGKGRTICLFLHQKCSGHKEPQNSNFQSPHAC